MKKEIVIWGAGGTGRQVFEQLAGNSEITVKAFVDSFKTGELFGVPIYAPEKLLSLHQTFRQLLSGPIRQVLVL